MGKLEPLLNNLAGLDRIIVRFLGFLCLLFGQNKSLRLLFFNHWKKKCCSEWISNLALIASSFRVTEED